MMGEDLDDSSLLERRRSLRDNNIALFIIYYILIAFEWAVTFIAFCRRQSRVRSRALSAARTRCRIRAVSFFEDNAAGSA